MTDVRDMQAAELLAEIERRTRRRAAGLPLTEVEALATGVPIEPDRKCGYCTHPLTATELRCSGCGREPLEKSEQADVVKLYRAYGCHVYSLSQSRASKQTPGLPDLWVTHARLRKAWWHETKRAISGRPSAEQEEFSMECTGAGIMHTIGGLQAARALLGVLGIVVD